MYHHSILTKAISVVKALTTVNTCLGRIVWTILLQVLVWYTRVMRLFFFKKNNKFFLKQ